MSDNIFTEIYNKILGLFGQPVVKDESKNTAVNRLRLVLMQDRTNLTPEIMNRMRSELIEVLSKYVELDKEALDLNIGQEGEQMALMLSIPVIRAKDEAEIQETLKKEDEAKKMLEKVPEDSETSEKTENSEEKSAEELKDNVSDNSAPESDENPEDDTDDIVEEDVAEIEKDIILEEASEDTLSDVKSEKTNAGENK